MQKISSPSHLRRGFSLVEILVVIAIIAVLAAIAYPVANKMIKKGQIEKNRGIVMSLEMAIDQFYDEYGYYPFEPSSDQLTDVQIIDMLNELHGSGAKLHQLNPGCIKKQTWWARLVWRGKQSNRGIPPHIHTCNW